MNGEHVHLRGVSVELTPAQARKLIGNRPTNETPTSETRWSDLTVDLPKDAGEAMVELSRRQRAWNEQRRTMRMAATETPDGRAHSRP